MKTNFKILLLVLGLLLFSCTDENLIEGNKTETFPNSNTLKTSNPTPPKFWDFNDLNEWEDASMNTNGSINYGIDNGILNIFTNANTWERPKIKSVSTFTTGTYSWRVYIPEMGIGDMASIGAFLYNNDTHELDFEVGYGKQAVRQELNAASDDLIVYMTSQGNPFQSVQKKIKRGQWYNLTLQLTLTTNGRYNVSWKINDVIMATVRLNYGKNTKFNVYCSVENLQFIGDHIPQSQNYALFDYVEFKAN